MNSPAAGEQWDERASACRPSLQHTDAVFENLFERCADAIWLHGPQTVSLVDGNQAAVESIGATDKQQSPSTRPQDLSPSFQPDGSRSAERTPEILALVEREKRHCFQWALGLFSSHT